MTLEPSAILHSDRCATCVFGEDGFINPICVFCPDCTFGKRTASSWMTRETAETIGLVKKKEVADE